MARPKDVPYQKLDDKHEEGRYVAFMDFFTDAKDTMDVYWDRADTSYELLRFYMDKDSLPYANVFSTRDTLAFWADETARMFLGTLAARPYGAYKPRFRGTKRIAKMIEKAVQYFLEDDEGRFAQSWFNMIGVANAFGTGHSTVVTEFTKSGDFDGFRFDSDDYYTVVVPGITTELSKRTWGIFKHYFIPLATYYDMVEAGIWKESKEIEATSRNSYEDRKLQFLQSIGVFAWFEPKQDEVYIQQLYLGDGHEIVYGNNAVEIMNTLVSSPGNPPHPGGIPMYKMDYQLMPNEYLGMGIPELVADMQIYKNKHLSQKMEVTDLSMNPVLKVRRGLGLPVEEYKMLPGKPWYVYSMDDIEEFRYTGPGPDPMGSQIDYEMENAVGSPRYSRGMAPERRETARGIMHLQQAAQARPEARRQMADFETLRRVFKLLPLLIHKHVPTDMLRDIVGEDPTPFKEMSLAELKRQYFAEPVSSAVTNDKAVQAQLAKAVLDTMASIPPQIMQNPVKPFFLNYEAAVRRVFETLEVLDVDEMVLPLRPPGQTQGQGGYEPSELLQQAGLTGGIKPVPAVVEQGGG
uniref:Putative structural protein n=1 Tax=viral metagenome TaxID=1070528 RepID=A0A6H1ZIA4_9ZZZZ